MTFPNAYNGIKKVFTAQILSLIAAVCSVIGAITAGIGLVAGSVASGAGGGFFLVASFVLSILSLIFMLIGLNQAGRDEEIFKKAFIWSLINLIISVIGNVCSLCNIGGTILESVINLIMMILGIIVIAYIFKGIESLAYKLGRDDMVTYGRGVLTVLYISYGVTIFCNLMGLLFSSSAGIMGIIGVISLIAGIAMIVGYIMYLVYLSRAKNMLAA